MSILAQVKASRPGTHEHRGASRGCGTRDGRRGGCDPSASEAPSSTRSSLRFRPKGKSEPVPAWRALHPIARLGTEERDRTPFVGRDLEFSMLTQLFERSRSRPATEFVTIVAEPGLGKSRLVRELARHVDQSTELVTWREGGCLPYGDGISFRALGEIVRAQAGILETDDQEPSLPSSIGLSSNLIRRPERGSRIASPRSSAWRPRPNHLNARKPSAPGEFPRTDRGSGPTVLVIEDLHWADEAFVSFLEHLAERTAGLPLLVVVTARPEVEERHPSWPPGRHSTVLSLSRLDDGTSRHSSPRRSLRPTSAGRSCWSAQGDPRSMPSSSPRCSGNGRSQSAGS